MIEAELPDGTVLEFPDGTDPAVIQRVVKQQLGVGEESKIKDEEPTPKGGSSSEQAQAEEKSWLEFFTSPENIVGKGEIDTLGEYVGDVLRSGGAGLLRGARGALELPEMAGRAAVRGYEYLTGAEDTTPVFDTATGRAINAIYDVAGLGPQDQGGVEYRSPTTAGKFAGTIGEFSGGAGAVGAAGLGVRAAGMGARSLGANLGSSAGRASQAAGQAIEKTGEAVQLAGGKAALSGLTGGAQTTAAIAGAGSEAAGQLTEDTAWEPAARIAGALISPAAATKAFSTGNKTIEAFKNINKTKPTVESLKAEKTAAYNAVKSSGQGFTYSETQDMVNRAIRSAFNQGAYSVTDDATMAAVDLLESLRGQTLSLSQFDKIQRKLNKIYKKAPDQPEILTMKKSLDDSLALKAGSDNLVKSARAANAKYAKAKLLQKEFGKHERQAQASGTGGNVVNKYRQSIQKILDNPSKATFFTDDEIRAMEKIVKGSVSANTLRLAGKMAPTGNGLMTYLNVVTVSINPTFLGLTVGSTVARKISEAQIRSATKKLQELVMAGGVSKKEVTRELVMDLLTEAGGLSAQQEQ